MSSTKLTFTQAYSAVVDILRAGWVPMLRSRPGAGKSAMMRKLAKEKNLTFIDVRLAQMDPTDLNGFPKLDGDRAKFVPVNLFPIEGDKLPAGSNGWLLFLDELTNAPRAVQAAAYRIILDREVGEHKLHEKCLIVAAGNNLEDKACANEMSTALQSRLIHLHLENSQDEFVDYMIANDWSPLIIGFLNWKPNMRSNFSPDHQDYTFACERTWEMVNDLIQQSWKGNLPSTAPQVLAGTLSLPVANEFMAFTRVYKELPELEDIIKNPTGTNVPSEMGTQFALAGMLGFELSPENGKEVLTYIERMNASVAILAARIAYKRDSGLIASVPALREFAIKHRQKWMDAA